MINIVTTEDATYKDGEVNVEKVSILYSQNGDTTEDKDEVQELKFETRDNGMGRFVAFKTNGWSLDESSDFVKLYNDFCQRAGIKFEE